MKKSELKNIIKECVKEVIFEEGVLSGIITEVVGGLKGLSVLSESKLPLSSVPGPSPAAPPDESKRKVLDAIAAQSREDAKKKFKNPALFEGTTPIPSEGGKGALAGIAPSDHGVDISNIPGFSNWGNVANALK